MDIDDAYEAEEELKLRQGAALYPLGRALRTTFDADNPDSLGGDVTGLMLELTRIPFEPGQPCARDVQAATTAHEPAIGSSGLLGRLRGLLGR